MSNGKQSPPEQDRGMEWKKNRMRSVVESHLEQMENLRKGLKRDLDRIEHAFIGETYGSIVHGDGILRKSMDAVKEGHYLPEECERIIMDAFKHAAFGLLKNTAFLMNARDIIGDRPDDINLYFRHGDFVFADYEEMNELHKVVSLDDASVD